MPTAVKLLPLRLASLARRPQEARTTSGNRAGRRDSLKSLDYVCAWLIDLCCKEIPFRF